MLASVLTIALLIPGEAPQPETWKPSIALKTAEEAWMDPGFRIALAFQFDGLLGIDGTPSGLVYSAFVKIGLRLDPDWSLFGTFRYGVLPGSELLLRFSGTVEPTLHLSERLTLALGFGLGGIVQPNTGEPSPEPGGGLIAPYTLSNPSPLLGACAGLGVVGLARLEYSIIVSPIFATGPALQVDGQYTACVESLGRTNPDTGERIELRQYWPHLSIGLAWMVSWR